MKTNIIKLITFFSLSALFVGCSNREEDLFKESASTRLEKNRSQYQNILENSEYGWVLQYFAHPEQKFGGVNYYVNFKDGNVTAGMNGLDIEISSTYSVINRGGNLLSFNSYNLLLHLYANPSGNSPKGAEGDFEFLILNQKDNVINLKGTRTGNLMKLVKLTEPYKDYNVKVNEIDDIISGATLKAKLEDTNIEVSLDNSHLTFVYEDNNEQKSETIAFITTDKGINLYEAIKIKDISVQEFILDKKKKTLISADGKLIVKIIVPPVDFSKNKWTIDMSTDTDYSLKMKEIFDLMKVKDQEVFDETLSTKILLGLCHEELNEIGISFNSITPEMKRYRSHYNLTFTGDINHDNYVYITATEPGLNWKWYKFFKDFVDIIDNNSPYQVTTDNDDDPSVVKMVSTKNPDVWFVIKK